MIKCAVFDLDGTLLDTLTTIAYYCNKTLETLKLEPIEKEKYKYFVGEGARLLIKRILEYREFSVSEERLEEILENYLSSYNKNPEYLTAPYEGIPDLLKSLKEKGIALAVLSNKPESSVLPLIEKFFPENTFAIIKGQRDDIPKKPDPTALFDILKKLNATPHECLYVGDTSTDMQTGKNAGVKTVGVLWGFREKEELIKTGADLLATTPKEILSFI
jgi:phosphoglycolate phosphatase